MTRSDDIDVVLADAPQVHDRVGVWRTTRSCYERLAAATFETTLETGLGLSTALFARWSTTHICVVHSADEVERFRSYASERELDISHVTFEVGQSEVVLPRLTGLELDLVLIDGGHGFPTPIIDWFYTARLLRTGGLVVVDDVQLPAVTNYLVRYLRADPRWEPAGGDDRKWIAFRKGPEVELPEEWRAQPFLGGPQSTPPRIRVKRAVRRLADGLAHPGRRARR